MLWRYQAESVERCITSALAVGQELWYPGRKCMATRCPQQSAALKYLRERDGQYVATDLYRSLSLLVEALGADDAAIRYRSKGTS
jgi:hypothetical protein